MLETWDTMPSHIGVYPHKKDSHGYIILSKEFNCQSNRWQLNGLDRPARDRVKLEWSSATPRHSHPAIEYLRV